MPIVNKPVRLLGREPVPRFARVATLCWNGFGATGIGGAAFDEQWSVYNVAALALYPRKGALAQPITQPLSLTFWSHTASAGIDLAYGAGRVVIPHDCEWYSVAWMTPPAVWLGTPAALGPGPYPEDLFRVRWELAV